MATREWDAQVYHRVSEPQVAWGAAVLERLSLRGDETALDAGCGTGRLSSELLDRLPGGRLLGVDASLAMVREAARTLAGRRARVLAADLLAVPLAEASVDLVFSTATFHWIHDHDRLFAEMHRVLRPGGRLVAQCGGGANIAGVLAAARQAMRRPRLAPHFGGWADAWTFAGAADTALRLRRAGFTDVDTGLVAAPTVMPDRDACAEFLQTVILRPFLSAVPDQAGREYFVDLVLDDLAGTDPPYLLDYWRLNLSGRRAA